MSRLFEIGGRAGLIEPLASRPVPPPASPVICTPFRLARHPLGIRGDLGVGGVVVDGRMRNVELRVVRGLKLVCEWLGDTVVRVVGCSIRLVFAG